MKKSPKCILFDCDGVLVDSEPITCRILAEMSQAIGIDVDYDFIEKHFIGNSWASNAAILEAQAGGTKLPDTFYSEYRQRAAKAFKKELQPIKGIPELINSLTIPFGVASSGPTEKIRLNLGIIGLLDQFEGNIFSCWDIQKWKPNPAIFLHAAKSMGFDPSECIVVEDSLFGIKAAVAGGFRVIGYANAHNSAELAAAGAEVITDMNALFAILI